MSQEGGVEHVERALRASSLPEDAKLILWHLLSRISDLEAVVSAILPDAPPDPLEAAHLKLVERVRARVATRRP